MENPYEPGEAPGTLPQLKTKSGNTVPATHAMTAEDWFNLFCKALGLYWFVYGVLTTAETLYAAFTGQIWGMTIHTGDQSVTALWGVAMLVVGAFLVSRSRRITNLAFSFDQGASETAVLSEQRAEEPTDGRGATSSRNR